MIWLKAVITLPILSLVIGSKLNVPRVLLPYNHDKPSNFTLRVLDGGCYDWTSSRNVVQLFKQVDTGGCSKEAVVSAVTRSPVRQTAIIIANEMFSGISFRCDVIIDSVDHLEIVTTTRELFVEEAPEKFEIRGYDNLGNEFSTLEGQEFIWDLHGIRADDSTMPTQAVLRFISFAASPYEAPHGITPLEERGQQGYMVLVEGRQTGIARLSARMAHSSYNELPPVSVDLMVVANLILEPQDVYILPFTTVYYTVHQLKQGHLFPVKIEGSQYSLETTDSDVGKLEKASSSITGLHQGTTLVILKDNNVKSSLILKQPTASLHVVNPSYMTITIVPHNNPNLINGEEYNFLVNIFDDLNNKILLTDNIVVQIEISSKYFDVVSITKNGTYLHGKPIKIGATKISAILTSVEVEDNVLEITPSLEASLDLIIMKPIKVIPSHTLLPWDPVTKPKYNISLEVEKNTDVVTWTSHHTSLVNVSSAGRCYSEGFGFALVKASLAINPHNSDSSEIHIKEATRLHLPHGIIEAEVGKLLPLGIALSTKMEDVDEMVFSSCLQVSLKVHVQDNVFQFNDHKLMESSVPHACATAGLIGQTTGFSKVTVSYSSPQKDLKADIIIGAYNPLRVVSPEKGETVLAVESSRVIVFEGGPLPWFSKPTSYYVKVHSDDTSVAIAEVMKKPIGVRVQPDVNAVYVECLKLGVMKFNLTVGNSPSSTLRFPQMEMTSVTVRCASPDSIALKYNFQASSEMRPCPAQSELGFTIAHYLRPLFLDIMVLDSQGRKFDNISSLKLQWSISNEKVATLASSSFIQTKNIFGFNVPLEAEQEVKPNGIFGNARIDVNLLGIFPAPTSSINVKFVDSATLQPANITLFNHKDNKAEFNINRGSGFFHLEPVDTSICSINFLQKENKLVVYPVSDGSTTVSLIDLCLQEEKPATAIIKVASVGAVDFYMHDRVELGGYVYAEVIVKDKEGTVVPVHNMMSLTAHTHSNIIATVPQPRNSTSVLLFEGSAVFAIKGLRVGDASLRFSARITPSSSLKVFTAHKPIQVFPPLQVMPKNVTLIVGAVYQVESKGGPYPDSSIDFIVSNETVAVSSHTGVLTALNLGITTLIARAVSPERNGDKLVVYSQDTVIINVVMLTSIQIKSPLKKIEVGSIMPLYAIGQDISQNPLAYGSATPSLMFKWSVNNKVVLKLQKLYAENEIMETDENLGIVRVTALKPGRVNVNLKVIVDVPQSLSFQIRNNIILEDTIEIMVFDSLKLLSPMTDDARILMTPYSSTRMVTNSRASEGKMTYSVDCRTQQQSMPIVSVSEDGVVTSGSATGSSTVIITRIESSGVKQQLAVLIEVEHVIYVQANPSRFMTVSGSAIQNHVPVGASHILSVSFHDNSGRMFHATNSELLFRPSRFDLVNFRLEATNNTLNVTTRGIGQTVLHIWDSKNPLINDFVRIETGPAILPFKDVTFGERLILSSPVRNTDGEQGIWESDSPAFKVDKKTGIGVAKKVGKVSVTYQLPSLSTTVELNIAPVAKYEIKSPGAVSNARKNETYYAMMAFSLADEEPVWNTPDNGQIAELCQSNCNDLFDSKSPSFACTVIGSHTIEQYLSTWHQFIPGKGHACVIKSLIGPMLNISRNTQEMKVMVSTRAATFLENGPSDSVMFKFYAAAVFEKTEVYLSKVEHTTKNVLIGHPDLLEYAQIISTENKYFDATFEHQNDDYVLILTARLSNWNDDLPQLPFTVSIECMLNAHKIDMTVHLLKVGSQEYSEDRKVGMIGLLLAVLNHYQSVLVSIVCLAVTVACMAIAYKSLIGIGYKQTDRKEVFINSPDRDNSYGLAARTKPSPNSTKLSPQTPRNLSFTNDSRQLWSVDRQPIYGDPLFRSSPIPAYEGSPVYRRSPS